MDQALQRKFEESAFGKPVYIATFFLHPSLDAQATAKHGIKLYQDELYIRIKTKGRKDNTVRVATEEDINLFTGAFTKFKKEQDHQSGSLETLSGYTPSVGYAFRDLGVTNIDELLAFRGPFPLAEMKRLWHLAAYLRKGMENYTPPVFNDDAVEEVNHVSQESYTQTEVLSPQRGADVPVLGECAPFDYKTGNGRTNGAVQQRQIRGVSLDEKGEATPYYG